MIVLQELNGMAKMNWYWNDETWGRFSTWLVATFERETIMVSTHGTQDDVSTSDTSLSLKAK